ncbi:ABC-F family ATP-binding cassette domain-containing protein [Marinivivus vitaminiproducens]|uniref:ABC-F family ATP-binding cassette domain-containing protein n=1 Tax=Marinivivus vitaminiproducens TaxID=3035935 RepID=UPI00279D52D9|nr:ATP-binding cassette domain-containing protein [Geminicoccaceae bacterium SCSIO 64248]
MAPPLLSLRDAHLRYGHRTLLADVALTLSQGERISLIGRNGSGKSTLLRVLAGSVELDRGERVVQPRTSIAYLPQEPVFEAGGTIVDHVMGGLPGPDPDEEAHRAWALLDRMELDGMRPLEGLSGGEARRVALARATVGAPDILLLDEPTNHLDLPTILKLEDDLLAFRGALVLISHDRAFLTRLTTHMWWLDRGQLRASANGFAHFEAWRDEVQALEEAEAVKLDRKIQEEMDWVAFGVTARRKRNQGRLRKLGELRQERRDRERAPGQVKLAIDAGRTSGKVVIEAEDVTTSLGGRLLFKGFGTRILRGDRIGVVGPNGAGKSTLLRVLLGELAPDEGKVRLGTNLDIAVFDQKRASLKEDLTPWTFLCPDGGDQVMVRGQWRHVVGHLRDFLFREEQARAPIATLSGGERNRLLLAKLLARPSNLLVLDEPTNDLDMDTLDLLEDTLADYEGTLLLVSHDRDFIDRLVTSVIAFEGQGRVREYAGGYSDMAATLARIEASGPPPASARKPPAPSAPPARAASTPRSGLDGKQKRELDRLPERMARLEAEVATHEATLADPDLFRRDPDAFAERSGLLGAAQAELAQLEERWLELSLLAEDGG